MRHVAVAMFVSLLLGHSGAAQDVRPGQQRPELPELSGPEEGGPLIHPELPSAPPGELLPPFEVPGEFSGSLEPGQKVEVRAIRIDGCTVFDRELLETIVAPYTNRSLGYEEIEALRESLSRLYVDRGYVTSGAVVPDQSVESGTLVIRAVEQGLSDIEVESDGTLRPAYIESRIELGAGIPVNVHALERQLRILQRDRRIASLHASLVRGAETGGSVLRVHVVEAQRWSAQLSGGNHISPVIGAWSGEVGLGWTSLTGWGDAISAGYEGGEGLHDVRGSYEIPLTRYDTSFRAYLRRTWSEVVEEPFDDLGIESRTQTYGLGLHQPVYRSPSARLDLLVIGEWRRSESFLFEEPFSFVFGPEDGVATISVLRTGGEWTWSSAEHALAARLLVSTGLPVLDATHNHGDIPDGEFVSGLAQLQWAQRFFLWTDLELFARGDLQLADRPLLGLEQFAIGGHATVRGYRETRLVRDNGLVGSLELRIPIPLPSPEIVWRPRYALAPFVDGGWSWNTDRDELGPTTLVSAGIGALVSIEHAGFAIYWGRALLNRDDSIGDDLQDDGIHLEVTASW